MSNKVLITGLNIISSLGLNLEENWNNLIKGKSGVRPINHFDTSQFDTHFAAQVPDIFNDYSETKIKKRMAKQMTKATRLCYVCAADAVENSNIDFEHFNRERCSVILGVVNTGDKYFSSQNEIKNKIIKGMNNAMPAWISLKYKLEGPAFTVSTACSSSAYAIAMGYDYIKMNKADLVIVGGADSVINPYEISGFNEIYALSTNNDHPEKASCPFSKNRDGFVIGEGAGIIILESEESAYKRNASVYAELAGYALTSECYNIMAPMNDGTGMAKTMSRALENTKMSPEEIDYINAHGTSTELNDKYETLAIKQVFKNHSKYVSISSTKSMIGHTIAAAGAIEFAVTAMSIKNNIIPPTINYDTPDPELDLDYVPNHAKQKIINGAISNSFAFGGHNATLVLKKY